MNQNGSIDDSSKFGSPAGYPAQDENEREAVTLFNYLLDSGEVKSGVNSRDKEPNADGWVEPLDSSGNPAGKLEVQVKKLRDNKLDPPKKSVKVKLLSYAWRSSTPFLLVGVDTTNDIAYWQQLDYELLENLEISEGQKYKTISFPKNQSIDRSSTGYQSDWIDILEHHKKKTHDFPELKRKYDNLRANANPAIGEEKPEFERIHEYLDYVNSYLDGEFESLKKRLYPDTWKLGFAYERYTSESLSYGLYPIPQDRNDVQIKTVEGDLLQDIDGITSGISMPRNPVENEPHEYAVRTISSQISDLVTPELVDLTYSSFLNREVIFGFTHLFHEYMGIDYSDNYSLSALRNGYEHLQLWVSEALTEIEDIDFSEVAQASGYINPNALADQLPDDTTLEQSVEKRLKQSDEQLSHEFLIGSKLVPPGIFKQAISAIEEDGRSQVGRPYKSAVPFERGSEYVEENLRIFVNEFPSAHDALVQGNLPSYDELLFKTDGKSVFVIFDDNLKSNAGFSFRIFDNDRDRFEYRIVSPQESELIQTVTSLGEREIIVDGEVYRNPAFSNHKIWSPLQNPLLPLTDFIVERVQENVENTLKTYSESELLDFLEELESDYSA